MNNLLRTLTASQVKSSSDLKLLLSTVKESRRQSHDPKLLDPFYDSLEGLLLDLRTITMDNRDAEAFLKPVSKADVPDYYEVIQNPIDLQTMLKKVKQKQYKSKREFKDDLDLIWSNCYTYNATENHPLRQCAKRLKAKAEKLLKNITDRKERTDPPIPPHLSSNLKPNGISANGHSKYRSLSIPSSSKQSSPGKQTPGPSNRRRFRLDAPFAETPAIVRSADGMGTFLALDRELGSAGQDMSGAGSSKIDEKLREYAVTVEEIESETEEGTSSGNSPMSVDSAVGEKRKLNGIDDNRRRKRARFSQPLTEDKDVVELWWDAVRSDALLGNGLPSNSRSSLRDPDPTTQPKPHQSPKKPKAKFKSKSKRLKKSTSTTSPKSLLALMNNNIRTMKRVRRTHAKFAALNQNNNEEGGEGLDEASEMPGEAMDVVDADISVDERPWKPRGSGIEIGEAGAGACVEWMSGKVLEHAGFQGTAKSALDVLAGVASEYLFNVGRTIKLFSDKFANKMTPEEIILHTLFESGTTKIQDLERYIKDDVVRHGSRLGDLEKKLVGAYREATAVEALDDEAFFGNEEDEEEDGAFVMGNFADALGDDFLGLRELGIAAEFGMSSLSIPKKLLKGKNKGTGKLSSAAAQPKEPPLPYPPPPPFVPLDVKNVNHQIGLLKPYYQNRLSALSTSIPSLSILPPSLTPPGVPVQIPADAQPPIVLQDDAQYPSQVKVGPLGQIIRGASGGAAKKKAKGKDPGLPMGYVPVAVPMTEPTVSGGINASELTQKNKAGLIAGAAAGVAGAKKKGKAAEMLPPVVVASA